MRLSFLLTIGLVRGLYEDQVDTFDWRRDMIGAPRLVHFDLGICIEKLEYLEK